MANIGNYASNVVLAAHARAARQSNTPDVDIPLGDRSVGGYRGIKRILGWSRTKTWREVRAGNFPAGFMNGGKRDWLESWAHAKLAELATAE
jgi:hypothetical protein